MKEVFLTLLWIIFIADSILLVLIVLLQSGRGGGLSGMLGGGGMAESALGPRSGLPKITGVMAGIFFLSSILIGVMMRPRQAMETKRPTGERPKAEQPAAPKEPKAGPEAKEGPEKAEAKEKGETKAAPEADKPATATPSTATKAAPTTSTPAGETP